MSNNSDWEYRLYFREWMRQQKFEQDRQDAIWRRARENPPKFKQTPPQNDTTPSRPTDIVFGFLLLAFSGWLGFKVYQHSESILFALGAFMMAVFIADAAYRYTSLGFVMRWLIRLGCIILIGISVIGNFL